MLYLYIIIGILVLWAGYSYARLLVKRIICQRKLKKVCKQKGFQLQSTHPLWFLSGKNGQKCDCYIETPTSVFIIKFFGVIPHLRTLVFAEENSYFLRRHVDILLRFNDSLDGTKQELPKYDFLDKEVHRFTGKNIYPILLINPVPTEMVRRFSNGQEVILNPGDKIRDMEVYNQSGLITKLENLS